MAEGPFYYSAAEVIDMLEEEMEEGNAVIDEPVCEGSKDDLGLDLGNDEEERLVA